MPRRAFPAAVLATLGLLGAVGAEAARRPLRLWSVRDGLPHEHTTALLRDSRDFLWVGTADGLARFDGRDFDLFGVGEGLPSARTYAVAQADDGSIWVGTERGLAVLDAAGGERRFAAVSGKPAAVRALLADSGGAVIAGGADGVARFRLRDGRVERETLGACVERVEDVRALARDARGAVWIGGANGRVVASGPEPGACREAELAPRGFWIRALAVDGAGRLWVGSDAGLDRLDDPAAPEPARALRHLGPAEGFPARRVRTIAVPEVGAASSVDEVHVGAVGGVFRFRSGAVSRTGMEDGLPDDTVNAFAVDAGGQLWMATDTAGLVQAVDDGFTRFDRDDGLGHPSVGALFRARDGALVVSGEVGGWVSKFDGRRFAGVVPRLPAAAARAAATTRTQALEDAAGDWWLATVDGLFRWSGVRDFEALATTPPSSRRGRADGLPSDWCYALRETADGALWVATAVDEEGARLARIDSGRARVERFGPGAGLPRDGGPTALAEGPTGDLVVGWSDGTLHRFSNGRFDALAVAPGFEIQALAADGTEIVVGTGGDGVRIVRADGAVDAGPSELAGADVRSIAVAGGGRIAYATASGVWVRQGDGAIRRFDVASGLGTQETTAALVDADGNLWIGTYDGVARRPPAIATGANSVPPVYLRSVVVDDRPLALDPLGARFVGPLRLGPGRHRIEATWQAPAFDPSHLVRARTRLVGVSEVWGAPSPARSLTFAGLASGAYRLEISAEDASGTKPAAIEWSIAPPFWARPAFAMLVLLAAMAAAIGAHRLRVARLVALERVRTRIASDLHDDLSASLTRISVLSEVGARSAESGDPQAGRLLRSIGGDARALLDSTRDLVWAIDPRDETLGALAGRLREYLDGLADPDGAAVELRTEGDLGRVKLRAEERRHLLRLLKEAIHNAVRHAAARTIEVRLIACDGVFDGASVEDDGRGFDLERVANGEGRGLAGLRQRAAEMDAELEIATRPGSGCRVTCRPRGR